MNFAEHLNTLSTTRLQEILACRSVDPYSQRRIHSRRDLCEFLASALSDVYYVQEMLLRTNQPQVSVVEFVCRSQTMVPFSKLTSRLVDGTLEQLSDTLDALEKYGLVFCVEQSGEKCLWSPPAVHKIFEMPLPLKFNLIDALEYYDAQTLASLHRILNLSPTATTKSARAKLIADRYEDRDVVRRTINNLSPEAKTTFDELIQTAGVSTVNTLAAKLDSRSRNQLTSWDWRDKWHRNQPRNPIEELLSTGLVVMDATSRSYGWTSVFVPGDIYEAASGLTLQRTLLPQEADWNALDHAEAKTSEHTTLLRDVACMMAYVSRNDVQRSAKGLIHRNVLKNVLKLLSVHNPLYTTFVYALAREAQLIGPIGPGAVYRITSVGRAWLERSSEDQLKALYTTWLQQDRWVENEAEPLCEDRRAAESGRVAISRKRMLILLSELANTHPGSVASVQSLFQKANYRWWSDFKSDSHDESVNSDLPLEPKAEESQALSSGRNVMLIGAALHWLQVVETVISPSRIATHIGLSAWGRKLLQISEDFTSQPLVDQFVVQPNLEIYAPPVLNTKHFTMLFTLCDPKEGGMFALSKEAIRKYLDGGGRAAQLLEYLHTHSATPIAQNVEYFINEIGGRHGHIRVGSANVYIQVDDPIILKELQAQKRLGFTIHKMLSETIAIVDQANVETVLKHLRKAGYLPVDDIGGVGGSGGPALNVREEEFLDDLVRVAENKIQSQSITFEHKNLRIDWDRIKLEESSGIESPGLLPLSFVENNSNDVIVRTAINMVKTINIRNPQNAKSGDVITIQPLAIVGNLLRCRLPDMRELIVNMKLMEVVK